MAVPTSSRSNPLIGDVSQGPPKGGEIGTSTPRVMGGGDWATFLDEAETAPDLIYPRSIETFHAMRTDSQIDALHIGTVSPIKEFRWTIDPNGAKTSIAEAAARDLGLPLKGEEDEPIPRARNKFVWDTFLADALLAPLYGFFDFEVDGGVVEGKEWRMDKMGPRHPRLTEAFRENDVGELTAIRQRVAGPKTNGMGMPEPIPAERLVRFVWRPEAGSHIGRSMLRSMFREWAVKDRVMRIAAINLQRAGGVPVIEGAAGMSNKQIEELAIMARQFKVAEGGGGAVPFGTKLNLVGGSVPDAISLLKYCDECMARVWALMLVQLGMTATGNRALGAEFAIYAARAQRAWAKWIKASVDGFLDRYVEWNDPFQTHAPLLVFEQDKPDSLSVTDLVACVSAGLIVADPELEEWLRSETGLPERDESEVEEESNERQPGVLPADGATVVKPMLGLDQSAQSPTLARGGATAHPLGVERVYGGIRASLTLPARDLRRPPSANEIRAAVDFRGLDTAHTDVTTRLQQAWLKDVLPAQIGAMGDQIRMMPALTKTGVLDVQAPTLGLDLLEGHLTTAAVSGAQAAKREIAAQGKPGHHLSAVPDSHGALAPRVADQATALARLNANAVSLAAQRKAQSLISAGGRSPAQVASAVEDHLKGQKHVWEREQLRGAVTMAQNQGRIAAFESQPDAATAVYEASELLDDRTCDACAAIDGTVFDSLEEATEAYAGGGYVDCEGGPNCRGTLLAVYPEQNTEANKEDERLNEPDEPYRQPEAGEEAAPEPAPLSDPLGLLDEPIDEGSAVLPSRYPTMHLKTARELVGEPTHYPPEVIKHAEHLLRNAPNEPPIPPRVTGTPQPVNTAGLDPHSPAFNAAHERALSAGPLDTTKPSTKLGGSVNSVYRTTIEGDPPIDVFVKPESATRDAVKALEQGVPVERIDELIRDNLIPGRDLERERAAYLISKRMGVPAPTTVIRDIPGKGRSLVSRGVSGQEARIAYTEPNPEDVHRVALFDSVIGNTDRHAGNYLIDDAGRISPIDHGLAFPDAPGYAWGNYNMIERAAWTDQGNLTADDRTMLEGLLKPEVAAELRGAGMGDEAVGLFEQRVRYLLDEGALRSPDELFGSSGDLGELPGRAPAGASSSAVRRDIQEAKELSEEMAANRARRAREVIDEVVVGKEHEVLANPNLNDAVHKRAQELLDVKAGEAVRARNVQVKLARDILAESGNPMGADLSVARRIVAEDDARKAGRGGV